MSITSVKRSLILALGLIFVLGLAAPSAYATNPYFKTFGGDVSTGGWFKHNGGCDMSPFSNYQDPGFPLIVSDSKLIGGIMTHAKENSGNSAGGSSVEFAAFALGLIEGSTGVNGFYSGGSRAPTLIDFLSFANNHDESKWGGLYQDSVLSDGTTRQSHCIPDYFGTKQDSSISSCGGNTLNLNSLSGQCLMSPPSGQNAVINPSGAQIPSDGRIVTVFVDGNAFIAGNITYRSNYSVDDIPTFALVVRGNIYVSPDVTRLDGLYIAQPDNPNSIAAINANSGIIWTCHANDNDPVLDTFPNSFCRRGLFVNGAFIAKQINMLRIRGDVAAAPDPSSASSEERLASALGSANIAEVFNYPPEMVVGGPFFSQPAGTDPKVQSLVSLPPVF